VKEVLETGLIPDESKALVDKEPCNCPARHDLSSDEPRPKGNAL
jgi:hypothetical protein